MNADLEEIKNRFRLSKPRLSFVKHFVDIGAGFAPICTAGDTMTSNREFPFGRAGAPIYD
jgi:hypothetical protein